VVECQQGYPEGAPVGAAGVFRASPHQDSWVEAEAEASEHSLRETASSYTIRGRPQPSPVLL
jgi:hypothetical protein